MTVAVGEAADSATEGTDYQTVSDFTVTIGAGATSGTGTFTLTPTQDLLSEGDETISVGGTATGLTVTGTSLTLEDDETASTGVTLSVNPTSVGEADAATAVVVTAGLDGGALGSATAVTVAVGDAGDSATEGTDYATVSDFTVTIGAGATSGTGTFTLTPTQDSPGEGDETISVEGTATGLTVTGASLTLEDEETAAAAMTGVTLSVKPPSVSEGAGPTTVTVTGTLSGPSAESNIEVSIMVSGGTAGVGADFVAVEPFPLTIPAGSTSGMATFTLTPVEEAAVEPDETVVVDGDAVDTVVVSTEMRILDNDSANTAAEVLPEIRISDAAADEASGAINFRLSLSAPVSQTVSVAWATDPRTAREGHDYIRTADTVTFPPGVTGATITVRLLDDRLDEIDETFQVVLYGESGATIADDIALGTIRDDDGPALTIEDATALETDGFISLRLVLSAPSPQSVTARWATSAQTATPGADYTEARGITRFSPGALSQTIVVEVLDDYIYEREESFVVSLTDVDNAIPQGPGTAVIVDNELPPGIRIFDQRATESSGVLAFLVALDRPSELPITVECMTASRTATGDLDYVEALQLIEIAPGVTEVRARVELIEDLLSEDDETFLALLVFPTNAVVSDGEAVGTIEDDDPDPAMSVLDSRASEEAGQIVFRIELDASSGRTVTVDWSTAPGTAKPGSDYRSAGGTVVLPAGKRVGEVRVDVINDRRDEPDETFQLVLSGAGNAEIARGTATGTIDDDDDAAPVLSAWLSRFGRTVTTQVAEAVGGRLNAPFGGSANMHLGLQPMYGPGVAIRPDLHGVETGSRSAASYGFESVSTFDLLSRSSFFLPLATRSGQEPFGWTVWGRGSLMRFSGADTPVSVSGDVLTGLIGLDYRRGRTVAGVAVAHSRGQGNFEQRGMARSSARAGTMQSSLTSVNPYLGISLTDRVRFWGMFGTGVGEMQVDGDWNTSDLGMRAGVLGMRGVILEPTDPSGLRLAVETDAFVTRVDSTDDLRPRLIEADASRARVRLEAARRSGFSGGGALTPRVEVAARYDGGDAETGAGLEMASGVAFEHPGWRLMADWSGRMLILHQDAEYREWGMSGVIQIQPSLTGEGLQGSVRTGYGAQANGTGQLFSPLGNVFDTPLQAPIGRHWDSEMGYGFFVSRDALLVPYAGVASRSKEFPSFRFGFRMNVGTALNLDLELNRRQATDELGVYGLFLRAVVR